MLPDNPDQVLLRRFMAEPGTPVAIDSNPVAIDVGMVLEAWDDTTQTLSLRFTAGQQHVQGNRAVHGGVASTMLDFAAIFAVLARLEPPKVAVTVSLNVHFERPVPAGALRAVARIDRLGGRMAFASAELMGASGAASGHASNARVLARASAVMAVIG